MTTNTENEEDIKMIEGVDYYFDDQGLMVMTGKYHLKRGYCCESDCKHCPYSNP